MLKKLRSEEMMRVYFLLVVSILFMSICTYTSPLYYFDYSPDNNAFFTVGKAMMHGIVPYKDLFEQKGPYVYFVHGLASLIAGHSLIGMFPFEVISLLVTMIFTYRLTALYLKPNMSMMVAIFSPIMYLIHPYFNYGDTTESLLYPFTVYLIYAFIKSEHERYLLNIVYLSLDHKINNKAFILPNLTWVALGASVGVIFLSKYTQLGSWVIFYIFIVIYYLIKKRWKSLGKLISFSGLGFLGTTVPWLIYFLITGSLGSFIHIYFYENIVVYGGARNPIFSNLIQAAGIYSDFLRSDPLIFVLGLVGMIYIIISNSIFSSAIDKTLFIVMNIGNAALSIYGYSSNEVYQYYELAFLPYLFIPVICFVIGVTNRYSNDNDSYVSKLNRSNNLSAFTLISCVGFSLFLVLGLNNNVLSSKIFPNNASVTISRQRGVHEPAQLVFGKIIRTTTGSNTTMLNYGSIDMGFYTSSGIIPSNYYFQNYNISQRMHPQIIDSQINTIKHRKVEWLVLDTPVGVSIQDWNGAPYNNGKISAGNLNTGTKPIAKILFRNYSITKRHNQSFENELVSYWLLRRRPKPLNNEQLKKALGYKVKRSEVKKYKRSKIKTTNKQTNRTTPTNGNTTNNTITGNDTNGNAYYNNNN